MAITSRITYPCPRCGEPVAAELHKSFVIEDEASLRTILDGRFHILDCARCGERRAFEADFLVTNRERVMFVQVVSRDDQVASVKDSFSVMLKGADVFARVVGSRDDLIEKVNLFVLGLDDVAVEVMKHFVRIQLRDLEGKTVRHFDKIQGEEMLFRVRTPGQPLQSVKLPKNIYHNIVRDLGTASYRREMEVDSRLAMRLVVKKGKPA